MPRKVGGFDWDDGNSAKCQKHGLDLSEIEAVFMCPHRVAPDVAHSSAKARFMAIGNGNGSRPIFVVFTIRANGSRQFIRPISARYMHAREIRNYETDTAKLDH